MKSMTGYGTASVALGEGELVAEIRALNHRYLEVRTTVSPDLMPYAHEAEQALRRAVSRGRYDLRIRSAGATPTALELDVEAARQTYAALLALHEELGAAGEVTLAAAIGVLPEPLRAPPADTEVGDTIARVVERAVESLDAMRREEAAALGIELRASLEAVRRLRDEAVARCGAAVSTQQERLRERVRLLLADGDAAVDSSRLEAEIALIADRGDVTEELVRIESHAAQLDTLLESEAAVGRKLDFLLQELNREANTLCAKVQDAAITHIGVEMKSEIERMRQQAANIL